MAVALAPDQLDAQPAQTIEELPLNTIAPAPDNPRKQLGDIDELAASMGELGMLQPLVVTPRHGKFMVVCGHRRYAAAKKAKLRTAPAIIRSLTEPQRIKAMLIENCQRENLSPLEEARAYEQLGELGLSQRQIAADVGKSQGHISKRLMLLKIPKAAAAALDSGGITFDEATELAKLADDPKRAEHAWKQRGQHYGGLKHAVKAELEAKERDDRVSRHEQELAAKGIRTLRFTRDRYGSSQISQMPKGAIAIRKGGGYDALNIDPANHADEPCHAIALKTSNWNPDVDLIPVCTDRSRHPKAKTGDESYRRGRSDSQAAKDGRELSKRAIGAAVPAVVGANAIAISTCSRFALLAAACLAVPFAVGVEVEHPAGDLEHIVDLNRRRQRGKRGRRHEQRGRRAA